MVLFVVTEVVFNSNLSAINLNMRVTPVPLPFPYQYTDESETHKILWVIKVFFNVTLLEHEWFCIV
jgi:hypothetical protein